MIGSEVQRLLDAIDGVSYLTDAEGVILACGRPGWDRALRQADTTAALPVEAVIGRPLLDFVAGPKVRDTYRLHMDRAAALPGSPRSFECRCDTPELSRVIRMSISALPEAAGGKPGFLFQSVVVRTTERVPVALFAFPPTAEQAPDAPFLGLCSYCQDVRFPAGSAEGEGEWVDAVEYYRRGGDNAVVISHGVCPRCFDTVVQDNLRAALAAVGR